MSGREWWDEIMGRSRTPLERAVMRVLTVDLADYTGPGSHPDDPGKYPECPDGFEWLTVDACRVAEAFPDRDATAAALVDCAFVDEDDPDLAAALAERICAALECGDPTKEYINP